jgi:hypothetical protein
MKALLCGLLGLGLVAALSHPADAGRKRKYRHAEPQHRSQPGRQVRPDYYEHIADKLPFGSSVWWEQMVRERRGGRPG